jgi:hypothetical protein
MLFFSVKVIFGVVKYLFGGTEQGLSEMHRIPDLMVNVKETRLEWLGNVIGMDG